MGVGSRLDCSEGPWHGLPHCPQECFTNEATDVPSLPETAAQFNTAEDQEWPDHSRIKCLKIFRELFSAKSRLAQAKHSL